MSRTCTICSHPDRTAIEAAHGSGAPNRRIAAQYGVAEASLRRHCASHMDVAQTKPSTPKRRAASPTHVRIEAGVPSRQQGQNIGDDLRPGVQSAFLAAFVELANESGACRAVQIDVGSVDWWEEHDETFSLRYATAKKEVLDRIRGEIYRRAVVGVPEPVISMGHVVMMDNKMLTVQKYSDALIGKLASAWMPEFRDQSKVDVTSNGQTVGQQRGVTLDELATIQATIRADLLAWRKERGYDGNDSL